MGCWEKTCGLSNLPIRYGEEVYVFVLVESADYHRADACMSDYLYTPVLAPFLSHYDDYGRGEKSSGAALPIIMDAIKEHMIEKELGENSFHDVEVKKEGFDECAFFSTVQEDRLEIDTKDGPRKVKFVMMRKSIVDRVLDDWEIEEYKGYVNGKTYYKTYKFKDVVDTVDDLVNALKGRYNDTKNCVERYKDDPSFESIKELLLGDAITCMNSTTLAGEWMTRLSHGFYSLNRLLEVKKPVSEMIKAGEFDKVKPLIIECIRGLFLDRFMNFTRRVWVPPCGEGCQTLEYKTHRVLASAMLSEIDAAILEDDEDK